MDLKRTILVVSTIAVIVLAVSVVRGTSTASTGDPALHLFKGWNLVGFPGSNATTTPNNLFAPLVYTTDYIMYSWTAPGGPYGLVTPSVALKDNVGYWVDMITQDYTAALPAVGTGSTQYQSASYVVAASNSIDNENANFVCDGVDDQVTINAAINSLPASGGSIYLREGTYILSGSIVIGKSNVTLVGAGASTVLKIKDNLNAGMDVIFTSGTVNELIQNLCINGNKAHQTPGYDTFGMYINGIENSKIVDCWADNLTHTGIYLNGSKNITVESDTCQRDLYGIIVFNSSNNNAVTGNICTGNIQYGIDLYSSSYNTVTGNTCQGNGSDGINLNNSSSNNTVTGNTCQGNSGNGIYLDHSANNAVTGNTSTGNSYGIYLSGYSDNNAVTGNICTGNSGGSGIYLNSSYNTISSNTCQGNGAGIYLNAFNNTIASNTCTANSSMGILLESSNNNTVTGNTVVGNSQGSNNTYDGIIVKNDISNHPSDNNNIQGNTVRRGTGANQQRYGIRINSANCNNNLVINNDLQQAGVTADYSDAGTGTIYHNNRTSVGWVP